VVNRGIFGGGVFSVARGRQVRMIGGPQRVVSEIGIKPLKGAHRAKDGTMSYAMQEPFLPRTLREELHHGGNSLCFSIQIAHLMGASRIYAVGFTLQTGSNYFFGRTNPVTRKATVYQHERAMAWCRWFESKFPGRVQLDPTFDGPIYSIFKKANFDAREATTVHEPPLDRGHEPKPDRVDADQVASRPVAKRPEPAVAARPAQRGRVIRGRPRNAR
jgi:hypothetical protein